MRTGFGREPAPPARFAAVAPRFAPPKTPATRGHLETLPFICITHTGQFEQCVRVRVICAQPRVDMLRVPHVLAPRMEANESFEFWFSMAGGGTFSHADAYCETTISMQFRGTKRWRIQSFPRVRHYLNATSFGDEKIYDGRQHAPWRPETEFKVGPGQCVVFPTGYLHETFVDPADNAEGALARSASGVSR